MNYTRNSLITSSYSMYHCKMVKLLPFLTSISYYYSKQQTHLCNNLLLPQLVLINVITFDYPPQFRSKNSSANQLRWQFQHVYDHNPKSPSLDHILSQLIQLTSSIPFLSAFRYPKLPPSIILSQSFICISCFQMCATNLSVSILPHLIYFTMLSEE